MRKDAGLRPWFARSDSRGNYITDRKNSIVLCFQSMLINRNPTCLISKPGISHHFRLLMGRNKNEPIKIGGFAIFKLKLSSLWINRGQFHFGVKTNCSFRQHFRNGFSNIRAGRRERQRLGRINIYFRFPADASFLKAFIEQKSGFVRRGWTFERQGGNDNRYFSSAEIF